MEERRSQTPGIGQSYSGYRVPKPHTFSGKGDNEDGTTIDSWIREVKSHFNLAKTPEEDHPETLQFWLEGRAKDFYWAKRLPLLAKGKDLNLDEFLKQLRKHIVPATEESRKWEKWNNIKQVQPDGTIQKITDVAVDIESTAWKLGASIGPGAKVQKLLDAMHPILKRAVEPQIKREDRIEPERWDSIVENAELQDDILYSTKAYDAKREKATGVKPKTAALESTNRNNLATKEAKMAEQQPKTRNVRKQPHNKEGRKDMLLLWKSRTFYKGMPKKETRPGRRTTTVSNGGSSSGTGRRHKEVFKLPGISTKQNYKQGFNISNWTKEQRHGNHIKDQ
jgi:hypothetical protein